MTVLIPFAGLSPVPWKNGGGSTTEIAIGPPAAGFEGFDWRVSIASIAASPTNCAFLFMMISPRPSKEV